MARITVGACAVVGPDGSVQSTPGALGVLWRTLAGATQIVDVLDAGGAPVPGGVFVATDGGLCPMLSPEVGEAETCFVSFGDGPRQVLHAHSISPGRLGAAAAAAIAADPTVITEAAALAATGQGLARVVPGKNLLDISNTHGPGTYWAGAGSPLTGATYAAYTASKAFPCTAGATLTGTRIASVQFWDGAGALMSGAWIQDGDHSTPVTFTVPAGAATMAVSYPTAYASVAQVEAGSAATTYAPYSVTVPKLGAPDGTAYASTADLAAAVVRLGWQHPRGASEEAGDATYSGAFYGYGLTTAALPAKTTFNQVAVRFAANTTAPVRVRVYSLAAVTAGSLVPAGNSTTCLLLADVTLTSGQYPTGTAPVEARVALPDEVTAAAGRYVVVLISTTAAAKITIAKWATNTPGDRIGFWMLTTAADAVSGPGSLPVNGGTPPRLDYLSVPLRDAAARVATLEGRPQYVAPRVTMPDTLHAVVGDTLEVFRASAIEAPMPGLTPPSAQLCAKGAALTRKWTYTPVAGDVAGSPYPLTTVIYDAAGGVMVTKTTNVVVKAPTSPATLRRVMCIGDSLTVGGEWPKELRRRLVGSGGTPAGSGLSNVAMLGQTPIAGASAPEGYFGNGGWTMATWIGAETRVAYWVTATHDLDASDQKAIYRDGANKTWWVETIDATRIKIMADDGATTLATAGTLTWVSGGTHTAAITYTGAAVTPSSPFYSGGTFSIKAWCDASAGGAYPDVILLLLGWNGLGAGTTGLPAEHATAIGHTRTFLDTVKAEFPTARVRLLGLQPPSPYGGLGVNYGAAAPWGDWWQVRRRAAGYSQALQDLANEAAYSSMTAYISVAAQFDAEYGYPEAAVPVNTRTTVTERRQDNGIHPASNGYLQIADAAYRAVVHAL